MKTLGVFVSYKAISIFLIFLFSLMNPLFILNDVSNDELSTSNVNYSNNNSISYLWNINTTGGVDSNLMATSSDGKFLVFADQGTWNAGAGFNQGGELSLLYNWSQTPIWSISRNSSAAFSGVDISKNGSYIIATTYDGSLYVWNNDSSIPIWNYSNVNPLAWPSISDDGGNIVVTDRVTEETIFFENYSSEEKWRIPSNDTLNAGLTRSLISPNGNYVVIYDQSYVNLYSNNSTSPIWEIQIISLMLEIVQKD